MCTYIYIYIYIYILSSQRLCTAAPVCGDLSCPLPDPVIPFSICPLPHPVIPCSICPKPDPLIPFQYLPTARSSNPFQYPLCPVSCHRYNFVPTTGHNHYSFFVLFLIGYRFFIQFLTFFEVFQTWGVPLKTGGQKVSKNNDVHVPK